MAYTTRKSLLEKMKNGDEISWREFLETYKPLMIHIAERCGLSQDDYEDLFQNVLMRFFKAQQRFVYDSQKPKLRYYLGKIIKHCASDIKHKTPDFDPLDEEQADSRMAEGSLDYDDLWEREWRKFLLSEGLKILRTRVEEVSYQAFDLYALQNVPVKKTAEILSISVEQVYRAKFRLTQMLRGIVMELREDY